MPLLEDYVDVDNEADYAERMIDQEIVAEVSNDRKSSESNDDEKLLETPFDGPNQCLQPNKPFKLLIAKTNHSLNGQRLCN